MSPANMLFKFKSLYTAKGPYDQVRLNPLVIAHQLQEGQEGFLDVGACHVWHAAMTKATCAAKCQYVARLLYRMKARADLRDGKICRASPGCLSKTMRLPAAHGLGHL